MEINIQAFMPLIMDASQSKNHALNALKFAKENKKSIYMKEIDESKKFLIEAHKKQTKLLNLEASGASPDLNVFLIHAMDHVSNAQIFHDIIKELAEIYLIKNNDIEI